MSQVLIDTTKDGWCHMVSDNIKSLHEFAGKIGLKRCWFQNKKGKNQPHYDLRESLIEKAIEAGAIKVKRSELFNFLKTNYSK